MQALATAALGAVGAVEAWAAATSARMKLHTVVVGPLGEVLGDGE
jgi:hypothetical protein